MLLPREELQCGVFDSGVLRGNKIRSAGRRVVNYELELFWREGGVSHVEDADYPTRRGMLLCAKPGQMRYSDFPVRCSYIRIQPQRDTALDALLANAPDCLYIEAESDIEELMGLFSKLGSVLIGGVTVAPDLQSLRANALLLEILYRAERLWHGDGAIAVKKPLHRMVADAYEYLNEHYAEECSLHSIAQALHVSPNYLHAVFLREVGVTPFAYVINKRVCRAKRLIAAGERSMLEIALEVGFCSQSHFNKVFKEHTGMTPVAYRRSLLEEY